MDQVKKARPGEPLAYDQRLGLTEKEYREFLTLSDSGQMRPARTARVVIESVGVGWRFGQSTELAGLRGLQVDTVKNEVRSPFGALPPTTRIQPSPGQRATGPWGGPQWKLEALNLNTITGTTASFAVGRQQLTGHTLIYFDAKRAENGQIVARESLFLEVAAKPGPPD
jgi:hypothetical protein